MWNKKQKAFTLVELMVVIVILSIGLIGVVNLVSRIFISARLIASKLVAAYLAQEGVEIVKNIRDTNWVEGAATWDQDIFCCGSSPCDCQADYNDQALSLYDNSYLKIDGGFYNYDVASTTNTKFKRKINVQQTAIDEISTSVTVSWDNYEVQVFEKIYDWR